MNINDKHIEVITRQMMRWVRVEDVGDTEFLIDEQVDKFRFMEENERVIGNRGPRRAVWARWGGGAAAIRRRPSRCCSASPRHRSTPARRIRALGAPAVDRVVHLGGVVPAGIPDARTLRVGVEETTRVLTEAAISGKIDYLRGLKENVTMGRLIPAGTGFWWYRHVQIPADEPPPPVQQPSDDELELDRETEYLVEPDEVDARGITEV